MHIINMALQCINIAILWRFALPLVIVMLFTPNVSLAKKTKITGLTMNVIDRCWRWNPDWRRNRPQLATCSVGYAGKMINNIGRDLIQYTMRIKLEKPLLISSFTAIDGRGADVQIAGNACLMIYKASNIIIHGLRIHHCRPQPPSTVMGPDSNIVSLGQVDGDGIRLVTASKVWLDHNTLYECEDGLLDVTRGSTDVTISNNWFRDQDKVMLLGHDDGYLRDKNMKVTVMYNHFGPNCNQRMPRIRFGYAHVVNNLYQGWMQYAIGGSMNPSVKSQANLFIAPKSGNKEVTWRKSSHGKTSSWNFYSVSDVFENGASFIQTGAVGAKPCYNREQVFPVADARTVRSLTKSAGVLRCTPRSRC
uniref:Pectate lyase domain-containing protein n=1 Tax=Fagus sylvatica TaxID=28930 RepID=A0A2N9ECR9_FAGSY